MHKQKLTVYCGSSDLAPKSHMNLANELGEWIGKNHSLVYGGGKKGLMGILARSVLKNGGEVFGIMPKFMQEVEYHQEGLTRFEWVNDMHQRKALMLSESDCVIALPGGVGTFEELLEAISWKRLGLYLKPIIIVNYEGYYDGLLELFDRTLSDQYLRKEHLEIFTVVDKIADIENAILSSTVWTKEHIHIASVV